MNRLSTALAFVKASEMAEKLAEDGGEPTANSPSQFIQFTAAETVRWRKLVKGNGIRERQ